MAFPKKAISKENQESPETPVQAKYDRSIVEGSLGTAVWKLAAPTMIASMFGGLQGLVDHIVVGNIVGYKGNAAIGVSWQIFLVVVVFVSSIFTGMNILVARFVGAGEPDKVNRTVYQAFITAMFISVVIIAPIGYFISPLLLNLVNADAGVQAEALPYLRTMFLFSSGMMLFFMFSGALRSAGDAKTGMVLGMVMTCLNIVFNILLISGFGPIPAFGVKGSAIGTCLASGIVGSYAVWKLLSGKWVISLKNKSGYAPDFNVIRKLFQFGLPAGIQAIAMNIGGVLMLSFIGSLEQSAAAQAAYAVCYSQLFSLVSFASVGLMGAASAIVGQNLGAQQVERANSAVHVAAKFGLIGSAILGFIYFVFPAQLLAIFGMNEPAAVEIGVQLLKFLSLSGIFVSVALTYTGGLQGTGDTKSPLYISLISQVIIPLGICFFIQSTIGLEAWHIWSAILLGHFTRCILSMLRFRQGKWRGIKVDLETTQG
jgi:putative MATE family efflux protein